MADALTSESSASVHWTYSTPDKSTLCQGDVIERTAAVLALLGDVHPYFAKQDKYLSFMLITQSCDLVRRSGDCNARHLTIAGVRSLSDVIENKELPRIASGKSFGREISMACKEPLLQLLNRLLNNNEPNYFFLRADTTQGVGTDSCACLRVSVPLRVDHYDTLLAAKRGQLADVFQAKLGWLVGTNYSRVGTPDWHETEQRRSDLKQLRNSVANAFSWIDDKRFQKILKVLEDRGSPATEEAVGRLKADPETEVPRRSTLFRRAFNDAWPEIAASDDRDEHRAKALVRAEVSAVFGRILEQAWPSGGTPPTREELLSTLRSAGEKEIAKLLEVAFDSGWAHAPRGPKRNAVLANLTKHNDFLTATRDP